MANQITVRRGVLSTVAWTAAGVAAGSLLTFFLDPVQGRRRRAYAKDKANHWRRVSSFVLKRQARHVRNHGYGWAAEAVSLLRPGPPPSDQKLESRVRSMIGRSLSHPSAVDVKVSAGTVVLQGSINSSEVEGAVRRARKIRGVKHVINRMEVKSQAEAELSPQPRASSSSEAREVQKPREARSFQELLT